MDGWMILSRAEGILLPSAVDATVSSYPRISHLISFLSDLNLIYSHTSSLFDTLYTSDRKREVSMNWIKNFIIKTSSKLHIATSLSGLLFLLQ